MQMSRGILRDVKSVSVKEIVIKVMPCFVREFFPQRDCRELALPFVLCA